MCACARSPGQAIAALHRALAADPRNAEVLLSLGVSYTNELDQARALGFLTAWLVQQPRFSQARPPPESSLLAGVRHALPHGRVAHLTDWIGETLLSPCKSDEPEGFPQGKPCM